MDLKSFAAPSFDAKTWINHAWSGSGNQSKEVFVSNTVVRLQLYMKQLRNSLDETTTQVVSSIPRVKEEAGALHRECADLQRKLMNLEMNVMGVEKRTGQSIKSLERIDQLKSRLENAESALKEADKWVASATWLEEVLEAGLPKQKDKLIELATKVRSMTASLVTIKDCPDYDTKKLQLDTLYNRLEAAVSKPFLEALNQMDRDRTTTYVSLYSGMHRTLSASRCWRRAASAQIAQRWAKAPNHSVRILSRVLSEDANKQIDWLQNVLRSDTPLTELLRLYTDLLLSLNPSPTKVIMENYKLCQTPEERLNLLLDLKKDIDEFVDSIDAIIEMTGRSSEPLSFAVIREFGKAAYAPLRDLMPKYQEAQTEAFLAHLNDPALEQEDLLERSRAILTIADNSPNWLEYAYNQGIKIANVAMYPYYTKAAEAYASAVLNLVTTHTRNIENKFFESLSAGEVAGVLSETFPSALVLENAAAGFLVAFAERQLLDENDEGPGLLDDLQALLLDEEMRNMRRALPPSVAGIRKARDTLKRLSRSILRSPIDVQLDKIPHLSVWHNNDALSTELPDFALSPQEYITEIGQYLMTLPQHLEMHVSEKQSPWQFLNELCVHTCNMYAEKILNIRNMDELGTKRCLTDIVYLCSVVEDLGSNVTPSLKNLEKSLRAAAPFISE